MEGRSRGGGGMGQKRTPLFIYRPTRKPIRFQKLQHMKEKKKNTVLFWVKEVLASPLFWELQLTSFRKRRDHPQRLPTSANEMINKVVVARPVGPKAGQAGAIGTRSWGFFWPVPPPGGVPNSHGPPSPRETILVLWCSGQGSPLAVPEKDSHSRAPAPLCPGRTSWTVSRESALWT